MMCMCTPLGLEEICSSAKLTRHLAWIHPLRMCEASAAALFRHYSGTIPALFRHYSGTIPVLFRPKGWSQKPVRAGSCCASSVVIKRKYLL